VLEIGTGSGYQAAVLSPLVEHVYTIEIVESLGQQADKTLQRLGYKNVTVKIGDGYLGWPEHAPFDKIIVTCSPENVPQPLVDQLKDGGMMIIPVGERHQQSLNLLRKKGTELIVESLQPTLFVPMTGAAEEQRAVRPDPANPTLLNGDFEEPLSESGYVPGWYYQRQLKWVANELAPSGTHFVQFQNETPLLAAHLMQGFSIDGSQVKRLAVTASVRVDNVRPGEFKDDLAAVAVTFYDANRKVLGTSAIGPFGGSKPWQPYREEIRVPPEANEGIVRIGLFGSLGTAAFDNVRIEKVDE
jgi:protein-L-isoaspartate(D-aspartate) O-methyltransferase